MKAQLRLERLIRQYEHCKLTKEELREHLEKKVVGRITGIMGPFVVRYHNGKPVISERAFVYNQSTSRASVEGRKIFANKVKFAQILNNIEEVKRIWTKADLEGHSAWNRIIKYDKIKDLHPTTSNTITPSFNHFSLNGTCSLTDDFRIKADVQLKEHDKLIVILSVYEPKYVNDDSFAIFNIEENKLTADQISICSKYRKYIIYSAVIRGDEWSNTSVTEGQFNLEICGEEHTLYWLTVCQRYLTLKSESNRIISPKPT